MKSINDIVTRSKSQQRQGPALTQTSPSMQMRKQLLLGSNNTTKNIKMKTIETKLPQVEMLLRKSKREKSGKKKEKRTSISTKRRVDKSQTQKLPGSKSRSKSNKSRNQPTISNRVSKKSQQSKERTSKSPNNKSNSRSKGSKSRGSHSRSNKNQRLQYKKTKSGKKRKQSISPELNEHLRGRLFRN